MNDKRSSYSLSVTAERDLQAIYYIGAAQFGDARATRYIEELTRAFNFLAEFPRAARLRDEISPAIRAHPCQSHLILYDIVEDGSIKIIRIRHGHEDWMAVGPQ